MEDVYAYLSIILSRHRFGVGRRNDHAQTEKSGYPL